MSKSANKTTAVATKPAFSFITGEESKAFKAIVTKAKFLHDKGEAVAMEWHRVLCSCLNHISIHNDTRVLDQSFRLIPSSMFRRGVSIWISAMANLRYTEDGDRFQKAKKSEPWNIKMEEAIATPFWQYKPADKDNNPSLMDVEASFAAFIRRAKVAIFKDHRAKNEKLAKEQLQKIESFAVKELQIKPEKLALPAPTKKEEMAATVAKLVKKNAPAASKTKQQLKDSLTSTETVPTSH